MWRAGLYNIDVSDWSPDDFKEQPPSYQYPEPRKATEPRRSAEATKKEEVWWYRSKPDTPESLSKVDVSTWKPTDVTQPTDIPDLFAEVDLSKWMDTDFTQPPTTTTTTTESLSEVDVSNWMDTDFTQH